MSHFVPATKCHTESYLGIYCNCVDYWNEFQESYDDSWMNDINVRKHKPKDEIEDGTESGSELPESIQVGYRLHAKKEGPEGTLSLALRPADTISDHTNKDFNFFLSMLCEMRDKILVQLLIKTYSTLLEVG